LPRLDVFEGLKQRRHTLLDQQFSIAGDNDGRNSQPIEVLLEVHILVCRDKYFKSRLVSGTKQFAILDVRPTHLPDGHRIVNTCQPALDLSRKALINQQTQLRRFPEFQERLSLTQRFDGLVALKGGVGVQDFVQTEAVSEVLEQNTYGNSRSDKYRRSAKNFRVGSNKLAIHVADSYF
jgi:hypothetical protein